MAEAWGSQIYHGRYNFWYGGVNAWVISETATTATIRVQARFKSRYTISSSQFMAYTECDGQNGSNGSTVNSPNADYVMVGRQQDFTIAKGTSGRNVWCFGSFKNTGSYTPGDSGAGVNVYVAARSYSIPHSPKNAKAAYVSDTRIDISWQGDYTGDDGDYPWRGVYVDRSTDGGGWVNIANLGWNALNYSDLTTLPNHKYEYRVASYNEAGVSDHVGLGTFVTTPAAPSSALASKTGETDVSITVSGSIPYADGLVTRRSDDGGSSWKAVDAEVSGSSPKWIVIDSDVPAGTVMYEVASVSGSLMSAYTRSNSVTTIAPPLAPSITGLSAVYAYGSGVSVSWTLNHPDGSSQTAAQIELTGAAESTAVIDGSTTSHMIDGLPVGSYGIRVRTKGLDPDWGAWSAKTTFSVAIPPSVFFTFPKADGSVIETIPLLVTWDCVDDTGISSQFIELVDSSGVSVSSASLQGDARSWSVGTFVMLTNKTVYRLRITVRGGSGLRSSSSRSFSTDWAQPMSPSATISYQGDMSAHVSVFAGDDGSSPATKSMSVSRVLADGDEVVLATSLQNGMQAIDRLPPLNTHYAYRITAITESGTSSVSEVQAYVDSFGSEVFNFGSAAQTAVVMEFDAKSSESISHAGESFHFALGPLTPALPMFYADGDMDVNGTKSYSIIGPDAYTTARRVFREMGPLCWYRSAFGVRAFVVAEATFAYDASHYNIFDASVSVTEVVWEEPVHE